MQQRSLLAALVGSCVLPMQAALAHGFAGPRMFISTLLIDDPNVADEASLPTFSFLPQPNDGGTTPTLYELDFEFDNGSLKISAFLFRTVISGCTPQVRKLRVAGRMWSWD